MLQLKDIGSMEIVPVEVGYYALGTLVAAIVGYVCIKTLLVVVRKKKFTYFAVYCLLIGILSIVGYFVLV